MDFNKIKSIETLPLYDYWRTQEIEGGANYIKLTEAHKRKKNINGENYCDMVKKK